MSAPTVLGISGVSPRHVGRYAIYDPIATGGMATVHLGRLVGPVGFARTVAIKRLHPQYARDPEFASMFLDEARLAARIQHPNVVPTIDVIATEGELLLVMEYVRGEALGRLVRAAGQRGGPIPPRIVTAIMVGALNGLHAAHQAADESGRLLGIVHRDVSPQNIIVGIDGVARVLDFGVAKAEDRVQVTKDQKLKGKLLYMSPEQLDSGEIDCRTDIYAMGIVLFEALTGQRMFPGEREAAQLLKITQGETRVPSAIHADLAAFDDVVRKSTAKNPSERYATARDMSRALEAVSPLASASDVGEWVETIAGSTILERSRRVAEIESVNRLDVDAVRISLAQELERSRSDKSLPWSPDSSPALAPPSEGSAASMVREAETSSRWLVVVIALLVAIAMGGAAVILVLKERAATPTPQAPTAIVSAPVEPLVARVPATTEATATAPVVDTTPTPSASHATVSAAPHNKIAPTATTKLDCEQPYVVDSAGHMHFRKECLSQQ